MKQLLYGKIEDILNQLRSRRLVFNLYKELTIFILLLNLITINYMFFRPQWWKLIPPQLDSQVTRQELERLLLLLVMMCHRNLQSQNWRIQNWKKYVYSIKYMFLIVKLYVLNLSHFALSRCEQLVQGLHCFGSSSLHLSSLEISVLFWPSYIWILDC